MTDSVIDTAARLDEIPFVEFTTGLIVGVFDAVVASHVEQTEQYTKFIDSLTDDLSTYINNTKDGVDFESITDFILAYDLPAITENELNAALDALSSPTTGQPAAGAPATNTTWWGGLINALGPAVNNLVDKIPSANLPAELTAVQTYNNTVAGTLPDYSAIRDAIATLLASNKYALLQNLARQGLLRLVVTDGEISTKMTFSTWETSEGTVETRLRDRVKDKVQTKLRRGKDDVFKRMKQNKQHRHVTVNTAKTTQRDTSGTKVDIYGHVLVRFKSDFQPLG
jgi:hypothetical protein